MRNVWHIFTLVNGHIVNGVIYVFSSLQRNVQSVVCSMKCPVYNNIKWICQRVFKRNYI